MRALFLSPLFLSALSLSALSLSALLLSIFESFSNFFPGNFENGLKMVETRSNSKIQALNKTNLDLNKAQNDMTKLLTDEVQHLKNDLNDTKNEQKSALKNQTQKLSESIQDLNSNLKTTQIQTQSLSNQIQDLNQDLDSAQKNSTKMFQSQIEALKNHQKLTFVQDCQHLRFYGFETNGFYSIDPDGPYDPQNHQDHPSLEVFCDFEQNITKVFHNQSGIPSNHYALDYGSDINQVKKMVENSRGSCYQDIIYDCYEAPLSTNGINYGWWLDNHGKRQYFLDGAYQNTTMIGCALNCNCDTMQSSWSQDSGRIRAYWLLPITGFGFQPYRSSSEMRVTISELICTGKYIFQLKKK